MDDCIYISNLELAAHIGITDDERANLQQLTVSAALYPKRGFSGLEDRIENTVDYAKVSVEIMVLASRRPRNLIETLIEEIAEMLLADFPLASVEIELRKFILPGTDYVAVKIRREAL